MWLVAFKASVILGQQALAPLILWASIWSCCGTQTAHRFAAPIGYLCFAVPIWDAVAPALPTMTIAACQTALAWFHVPSVIHGSVVRVPEGSFRIAEECSGKRYFVSALALASIFAAIAPLRGARAVESVAIAAGRLQRSQTVTPHIPASTAITLETQLRRTTLGREFRLRGRRRRHKRRRGRTTCIWNTIADGADARRSSRCRRQVLELLRHRRRRGHRILALPGRSAALKERNATRHVKPVKVSANLSPPRCLNQGGNFSCRSSRWNCGSLRMGSSGQSTLKSRRPAFCKLTAVASDCSAAARSPH